MKPRTCLVAVYVALGLADSLHAQADCADWNTETFFEAAEVSDVTHCLQAGADANTRAGGDITPLHMASNAEAVEARARRGITPLHTAALLGHAEAIEALLQVGADPKGLTSDGKLPFDLIEDEQLKGTNAYWKLYQSQFPDKVGQ